MQHGKREAPKRKKSPLTIALLVLFWVAFALSLVVVTGYLIFRLYPQAPTVPQAPTIPAASTPPINAPRPTDDPATPTDESQGTPETTPAPVVDNPRKEDCHTILLLGMDAGNGNTDTMMVVTYDVKNQKVSVVSIPRDTLVNVPRTIKKINAAYAEGGVEEVQREVSSLLGFPVDHYIIVNLRGFRALVDAVGGVDFYVPVNMNYDDPTQDLHIHLNKGMQHLDGEKAMQLVRFRSGYANADLGRIDTQQKFLTALAKKVLSWNSVTKINDFIDIFVRYVKTDLTTRNLAYFGVSALDLDTATGITTATLPGDGSVTYKGIPYYYQLYPDQVLEIVNNGPNPYEKPLTREQLNIFQVK